MFIFVGFFDLGFVLLGFLLGFCFALGLLLFGLQFRDLFNFVGFLI